jgi:hypothetical protein
VNPNTPPAPRGRVRAVTMRKCFRMGAGRNPASFGPTADGTVRAIADAGVARSCESHHMK